MTKIQDSNLESKLSLLYESIIQAIGEDTHREGLVRTPMRSAKALLHLTRGYQQNLNEIVNGAIFASENDEMVIVRNIELYSLCEHHLLPFLGKCHVGYLPNGKVLGLSKVARIVDMYACRLQIQENLTYEIARAIQAVVDSNDVGVVVEAQHMCMMMRGVEKQNSIMSTSAMFGRFRSDNATRSEFLSLITKSGV